MGFKLGNYAIDQLLLAAAENFDGDLLYTLDQLSSATIEVSSDPIEVTDKDGNVIRTRYRNKSGTFNATNALLNVNIQNAAGGLEKPEYASTTNAIRMPKMEIVEKTTTPIQLDSPVTGTVQVMGMFNNGANEEDAYKAASASTGVDATHFFVNTDGQLTLPTVTGDDAPTKFLVKYQYDETSGLAIKNTVDKFPNTIRLTLKATYIDPCDDSVKPCYIYIPSFQVSPDITINLDAENTEIDYNGNMQVDYCSNEKLLYAIYFPNEVEETEDDGE